MHWISIYSFGVLIEKAELFFILLLSNVCCEQCMVRLEDGKLVCTSEKFTHVREIQGEEMVEVSGLSLSYQWCVQDKTAL